MSDRAVELAEATGTGECVHCSGPAGTYCRSCRRAVCEPDMPVHVGDHTVRNRAWTGTETIR